MNWEELHKYDYYGDRERKNEEFVELFLKLVKWLIILAIIFRLAETACNAKTTEVCDSRNTQAALIGARQGLSGEISVIRKAAERNGVAYGTSDWYLLLAIRKAENGKVGREFGILNPKANTLELQAAWCAASIVAQHRRYGSNIVDAGYLNSLARRYCPVGANNDPTGLNKNWLRNVTYWYNKLKGNHNE